MSHISRHKEILSSGTAGAVPVICYGPAGELSTAWGAGCADYIKEPFSVRELHFRVERLLSTRNSRLHEDEFSLETTEMRQGDKRIPVSMQEYKILKTLLLHPGEIVPREALHYAIWGKPRPGSRGVDMHLSKIRRKLNTLQTETPEDGRIRIVTVRGDGYLLA